jgi:hypothetical protein
MIVFQNMSAILKAGQATYKYKVHGRPIVKSYAKRKQRRLRKRQSTTFETTDCLTACRTV